MKEHLAALQKIVMDFVKRIDSMVDSFAYDSKDDHFYNAEIQQQRKSEREADYSERIARAANDAQDDARTHFAALKRAVTDFVTADTDPALLAQLQALQAAGLSLNDIELSAYEDRCRGNYTAMRLLAHMAGAERGLPRLDDFKTDLDNLRMTFDGILGYRGEDGTFCGFAKDHDGPKYGAGTATGNAIAKGMIAKLPETLSAILERWETATTGPFISPSELLGKKVGRDMAGTNWKG